MNRFKSLITTFLVFVPLNLGAVETPSPSSGETIQNKDYVSRYQDLALKCVHTEYPNKVAHVLNSDKDVAPPRELYPAFYGCFDWHSSVHGHWLLARIGRLYPNGEYYAKSIVALEKSITAENIAKEVEYINGKGRASFERPYGLAWAMQLGLELQEWGEKDPRAKKLAEIYAPLSVASAQKIKTWLPKLYYPVRVGEHSQTAFGLGLIYDWASKNDSELKTLIEQRAKHYYLKDTKCPLNYEPSGEDFLSPCLGEASLMARILPREEYKKWLGKFLPEIPKNGKTDWLNPAIVTDRSDPKLAHLDGLNLSRAWMLNKMAEGVGHSDKRYLSLLNSAVVHGRAALPHVTGEHYEGGHWLGTFAMYYLTYVNVNLEDLSMD